MKLYYFITNVVFLQTISVQVYRLTYEISLSLGKNFESCEVGFSQYKSVTLQKLKRRFAILHMIRIIRYHQLLITTVQLW